MLAGLLDNRAELVNSSPELDPVVRMAVAHYQSEAIHPFTDGNGRTGRIVEVEQDLLRRTRETLGTSDADLVSVLMEQPYARTRDVISREVLYINTAMMDVLRRA